MERALETRSQVQQIIGHDSLQSIQNSGSIRFFREEQLEWIDIIPLGRFSYRPDSGFSGQATKITVHRLQQHQEARKDSSNVAVRQVRSRAEIESSGQLQATKAVAETVRSKPIPLYGYLIGLVAIGILIAVAKVLFFRK